MFEEILERHWKLWDKASNACGEDRTAYMMRANGILEGAGIILGVSYEKMQDLAYEYRYLKKKTENN